VNDKTVIDRCKSYKFDESCHYDEECNLRSYVAVDYYHYECANAISSDDPGFLGKFSSI